MTQDNHESSSLSGNTLAAINQTREKEFITLRDQIIAREAQRIHPSPRQEIGLGKVEASITGAVADALGRKDLTPQFKYIEREHFGADLAVTIPALLKEFGAKTYSSEYAPRVVAAIKKLLETSPSVEAVEAKGMYVNIKIKDAFLIQCLNEFSTSKTSVVENTSELGKTCIVEYSSPNVAKKLHAGHIRSTIVGHVLANIHAACSSVVIRINHLNDFGGFGFFIEGLKRWGTTILSNLSDEEKVIELYKIRRTLEKVSENAVAWQQASAEDRILVKTYLGDSADTFEKTAALVKQYTEDSNIVFENLENGRAEEVNYWQKIVAWSLADFEKFYTALNIHIDFTIGESFYLDIGNKLVDTALKRGTAIRYSDEDCKNDCASYKAEFDAGKINEALYTTLCDEAQGDIGAVIIRLANRKRLVVRRSDGRSIYATRDLGAVAKRVQLFNPQEVVYVVGQEQKEHFAGFFEASNTIGIFKETPPTLLHLPFGFYVDATTKKKLSSREGASSVTQLLADAVNYFYKKLEATSFSEEEKRSTAKELATASLVFNDLEKDIKSAVEIDVSNSSKTIERFEKAGGAYVIYTACRTKSLIKRFSDEQKEKQHQFLHEALSPNEIRLAFLLLRSADIVAQAASANNPSLFVRHLIDIAQEYSSYYSNYPVFRNDGVYIDRVLFAAAVEKALVHGLVLCNVKCPERI